MLEFDQITSEKEAGFFYFICGWVKHIWTYWARSLVLTGRRGIWREDRTEGLRQGKMGKVFPAKTQTQNVVFESLESGRNHKNVWRLEWAEKRGSFFSFLFIFIFLWKIGSQWKIFKHTFRFAIWGRSPDWREGGGEAKPRGKRWYKEGFNDLDNSWEWLELRQSLWGQKGRHRAYFGLEYVYIFTRTTFGWSQAPDELG